MALPEPGVGPEAKVPQASWPAWGPASGFGKLTPMATLICSRGHANPLGQGFCGECGEDLTRPDPAPETAEPRAPARPASHRLSTPARLALVALLLVIVFAAVALVALLAGRKDSTPVAPSAPTEGRGNAVVVWYFPVSTPETDLMDRVDTFCSAHPDVGSIQVNFVDLNSGNLTTGQSQTYPCPN